MLKTLVAPLRRPVSWALQRGVLPPKVRTVLPWTWCFGSFTIRGEGVACRYQSNPVDTIGQTIFWSGLRAWERETLPVFLSRIRAAHCFVDIGANCGIYTMLACAANPRIQVLAVEPVPKLYKCLEANVRFGHYEERVHLAQVAVSKSNGRAQFHESIDPTMGSLLTSGYQGKPGTLIDVATTTLDHLLAETALVPDFIKIDVESFEDVVLEGADYALSYYRPALVLEANPDGPYRRLTEILTSYGYAFYHLLEQGPVLKGRIEPNGWDFRNWLCTPKR